MSASRLNRPVPKILKPAVILLGLQVETATLRSLAVAAGFPVGAAFTGIALGAAIATRETWLWLLMLVLAAGSVAALYLQFRDTRNKAPVKVPETPEQRATFAAGATTTVVIPAWNESAFLGQALGSLQAQTYPYWRAIVVDDSSTDKTATIAHQFAVKDPRISIIRLRRNSGLPSARNAGLAMVETEHVLFLDADDALIPYALERRTRVLADHPNISGAAGRNVQVAQNFDYRTAQLQPVGGLTRVNLVYAAGENVFGIHDVLLRTDMVRALRGFNESMLGGGEDADFWSRAMRSGHEFLRSSAVDCIYRQKSTSMVAVGVTDHMSSLLGVLEHLWEGGPDTYEQECGRPLGGDLGSIIARAAIEQRLFRYLGMAASMGDTASMEDVRKELEARMPLVMSRDAALDSIEIGHDRTLRRRGVENAFVREQKWPETVKLVSTDLPAADIRVTRPLSNVATWAVLAENAAHVAELEAALVNVPDDQLPMLIVADSIAANQGAIARANSSSRPWQLRSVVHWTLDDAAWDLVLIPKPLSWVGEHVATVGRELGSTVRLVDFVVSELVVVEDAEFSVSAIATQVLGEIDSVAVADVAQFARPKGDVKRGSKTFNLPKKMPAFVEKSGSRGDYEGLVLPDIAKLKELKDKHRGEKCIIIGNGPSLNKTDFGLLKGVHTFGVNGIFYADDRLPEPLSYYVVEDTKVFQENTEAVLEYGKKAGRIILPTMYKSKCPDPSFITFFRMNGGFYNEGGPDQGRPRFSVDATEALYCGQSVTYINLQLAYWMGFSEVGLIGMDFSYSLPDGTVVDGIHYTSQGDDPNHFDPRYFGAGKTWKDPKLNRVGANYGLAKAMYEADGRKVVNCTVGGALEVFERVELGQFVRP